MCHNSSSTSTSIYTTNGDGGNCSLPLLSAVSLFYTLYDDSIHPVADTRAALVSVRGAMALMNTAYKEFGTGASARYSWWSANSART